jgi:DNA-binding transcriptional LysR family regulator
VVVPGVTVEKWARVWAQRLPEVSLQLRLADVSEAATLVATEADAGLIRLPVDRDVLHAIPLYTETTVVVVPKDHVITAADEVTLADVADEVLFHPLDDVFGWDAPPGEPAFERPATTEDAVELVAAGVGLLVVPQSLARLHHRRDLAYRPVVDAPQSGVALSWPEEATTELVEDFIGIVRGRTVNSSRGRKQQPEEKRGREEKPRREEQQKSSARRKPAPAKQPGRTPRAGGSKPGRRGRPGRRS